MLSSSVAASKFTSSAPTATPFGLPIPFKTGDRVKAKQSIPEAHIALGQNGTVDEDTNPLVARVVIVFDGKNVGVVVPRNSIEKV